MTVDSLVERARLQLTKPDHIGALTLAEEVIELLAEADPCGFESVSVHAVDGGWKVRVPPTWVAFVDPEDARHMARMLLRVADWAER